MAFVRIRILDNNKKLVSDHRRTVYSIFIGKVFFSKHYKLPFILFAIPQHWVEYAKHSQCFEQILHLSISWQGCVGTYGNQWQYGLNDLTESMKVLNDEMEPKNPWYNKFGKLMINNKWHTCCGESRAQWRYSIKKVANASYIEKHVSLMPCSTCYIHKMKHCNDICVIVHGKQRSSSNLLLRPTC